MFNGTNLTLISDVFFLINNALSIRSLDAPVSSFKLAYVPFEDSDQPVHSCSPVSLWVAESPKASLPQ